MYEMEFQIICFFSYISHNCCTFAHKDLSIMYDQIREDTLYMML